MPDVIAVSTPTSRTYPVPTGVLAEVLQGVRWSTAYGTDVPETYQQAATLLASGKVLDLDAIDDLALLFDRVVHSDSTGWLPGQDGYPSRERILSSLAGGSGFREWSEGIFRSVGEQAERRVQTLLSSITYDPDVYAYRGLCASADPDVVTDLVRSTDDDWQRWDASDSSWRRINPAWAVSKPSVEPDAAMLAAIVDAIGSGDRLLLTYATPVMFLPSEMPVTSLPDDVDDPITAAVVDDIDVTAVWSLVRIDPGPSLSIRAGGQWEPFDDWPEAGYAASLVVLDDAELAEQVMASMDAVDFGVPTVHADPPLPQGVVAGGTDLSVAMDHTFAEAIAQVGAYHRDNDGDYEGKTERRQADRALISDIETIRDWAVLRIRRDALTAALNGYSSEQIKPVVADLGGKYHPGARRLRRYWTRGRGALKIAWGVHGDWRRCYRKLFKYLGPRAAGYCFTGDTELVTRSGIMTFAEAVGTDQLVLTAPPPLSERSRPVRMDGRWVQARIQSYGEQPVLRVTLSRNGIKQVIRATPEHVWFASDDGRSAARLHAREVETKNLRSGMSLAALLPKEQISQSTPSPFGIAAGFVFGDGCREGELGCRVDLWGEKNDDLQPFFASCKTAPAQIKKSGLLGSRISGMPGSWKNLPALDEGVSYLYGWLAGYIAADGNVTKGGHVELYSFKRGHLEHVAAISARLGIGTFGVTEFWRKGYGTEKTLIYRMSFVQATVPSALLIRKEHRRRFDAVETRSAMVRWKVESVEDHGEVEEVFCAEVPDTETFALANNIWVHNCQLRHKETTGLYTGDKLHRAGVSTIKGATEPCGEGKHRMPDGTCMSDEEMNVYTAAAITAAYDGSGGMVALVPREADAVKLAVEGGESAEDLHVTLVFLGESKNWQDEHQDALVRKLRSTVDDAISVDIEDQYEGVTGNAFGFAHWNPGYADPCWVYNVSGIELDWVHRLVLGDFADLAQDRQLPVDGIPPQHVPWVPHITAKYAKADGIDLDALISRLGSVIFDRIRVSFGQDVTDIPLPLPRPQEPGEQLSKQTSQV